MAVTSLGGEVTGGNVSNNNITQSAAISHMPSTMHAPILIGGATYIHTSNNDECNLSNFY